MKSLCNTVSLEKFKFLRQFCKALRKLKKSCFAFGQLYIELKTTKSLFKRTSNLKLKCWQPKIQNLTAICCIVKLILWDLVNLSHPSLRIYMPLMKKIWFTYAELAMPSYYGTCAARFFQVPSSPVLPTKQVGF